MAHLENRIPPLLVAAVFAALMWGLSQVTSNVSVGDVLRLMVAGSVLALGVFFCLAGVLSFRHAKTTVDPLNPEAASALVSSGIYRVSRNPMYVGFALLLLAWAVFLASGWSLLGVAGFVLYINRFQIAPEERALAAAFDNEFMQYRAKVRRWL